MRRVQFLTVIAVVALVKVVGCVRTKSEVAVKPVDINLNITGRLEVVITDARRQEEQITGAKPKRTVRPEDIGLPPTLEPRSEATSPGTKLMAEELVFQVVRVANVYAADTSSDRQGPLIQKMAARRSQIVALLDSQLVGESHTGLLVPRGNLSTSQQALVNAENADRTELYKLEAAKKNSPVDTVTTGYYLARLEHVNKGTWVERYNKTTGKWEWFQWDR